MKTTYRSRIAGTGSYLPEKIMSNDDLVKLVDTTPDWISERTGIQQRRYAAQDQVTTDLGLIASKRAMEAAKITAEDLDLIIFCTSTPDQTMPSAACVLQHKIGAGNIMAFDLGAACSGFVYGFTVADQFIRSGAFKNVLVVGGEILHRYINYKDRDTAILFGDGAGAVVLQPATEKEDSKVYEFKLVADGSLGDLFVLPAGGTAIPFSQAVLDQDLQFVRMKGREIFKNAVRTMSNCCQVVLEKSGLKPSEIDWLVPHQANVRILEAVAKHFEFPMEKVIVNIEKTGNTSAGTVPIALDEAVRSGKIKRGQNLLFTAFGAGLTSGSIAIKY